MAEAEVVAAEAAITLQKQAATRRCEAAEGRLESLTAAKSAATTDITILRSQIADIEEAKRVVELERDAALKASRQRAAENEAGLVALRHELANCQAELSRARTETRTADRRADEARAVAAKTEEALARLEWELSRNTVKNREAEDQLSLARREIQMLSTGNGLRGHVSASLFMSGDDDVGTTVGVDEAVPPLSRRGNASPRGYLADMIRELAALADEDLITEEEFTQGKDELIASLQPF
jgi:predicted  nucleic acid-binding Zn-ribbon protein